MDVSLLAEIDDGKLCKSLHSMECPCAMASAESRELVSETAYVIEEGVCSIEFTSKIV